MANKQSGVIDISGALGGLMDCNLASAPEASPQERLKKEENKCSGFCGE